MYIFFLSLILFYFYFNFPWKIMAIFSRKKTKQRSRETDLLRFFLLFSMKKFIFYRNCVFRAFIIIFVFPSHSLIHLHLFIQTIKQKKYEFFCKDKSRPFLILWLQLIIFCKIFAAFFTLLGRLQSHFSQPVKSMGIKCSCHLWSDYTLIYVKGAVFFAGYSLTSLAYKCMYGSWLHAICAVRTF